MTDMTLLASCTKTTNRFVQVVQVEHVHAARRLSVRLQTLFLAHYKLFPMMITT